MDDVTLTEITTKGNDSANSNMTHCINHLKLWSKTNSMKMNFKKTKEIILGTIRRNPPLSLFDSRNVIDRVKYFRQLGINVSDNLHWGAHVDVLCAKVASRLYFFKILKRFGLPSRDLLRFYKSVIRSVDEYSCMVWHWHHNLTSAQSDQLEAFQKRTLRIILHPMTLPYNTAVAYCETESLKLLRHNFQQKLFKQICHPGNCLHDDLPPDCFQKFGRPIVHTTFLKICCLLNLTLNITFGNGAIT